MTLSDVVGMVLPLVVGLVTAMINVVAGGGSLLTIPVLVELGLSPQQANATNRVGILLQSLSSSTKFARDGNQPWGYVAALLPSSVLGAVYGAHVAASMSAALFQSVLAWLFAGMGVFLVFDLARGPARSPALRVVTPRSLPPWGLVVAFGAVGFYGGFIQAGVGIVVMLVVHVAGRVPLVPTNAIKMTQAIAFAAMALVVFVRSGDVVWWTGLWLGVGGLLGGWLGARVASRVDPRRLKMVLVVAVFAAAARFAGWI